MSFMVSNITRRQRGGIEELSIPTDTFLRASADQGLHDSIMGSIYRMSELETYDNVSELNPIVDSTEANRQAQEAGLELKFNDDITADELSIIMRRKKSEQSRNLILSAGQNSASRFVGGMGTQMLASMLNPVDIALMFVPVVGSGGKVANVTKAATTFGRARQYLNTLPIKGIVTNEAKLAANNIPKPWLLGSIIDGAAGQAMAEIPLAISNFQDQSEYTGKDFFINVAAGGVFSAGLRGAFRGLKLLHSRLSTQTKEQMMLKALDDFANGKDISIDGKAAIDESTIRANSIKQLAELEQTARSEITVEDFELRAQRQLVEGQIPKDATPLQRMFAGIDLYHFTDIDHKKIKSEGFNRDSSYFTTKIDGEHAEMFGSNVVKVNNPALLSRLEVDTLDLDLIPRWMEVLADDVDIDSVDINDLFKFDQDVVLDLLTDHPELLSETPVFIKGDIAPEDITVISKEEISKKADELREKSIKTFLEEERARSIETGEIDSVAIDERLRAIKEGTIIPSKTIAAHTHPREINEGYNKTLDDDIEALEEELGVNTKEDKPEAQEGEQDADTNEVQTTTRDQAKADGFEGPYYHGSPDFVGDTLNFDNMGRNTGLARGGISFSKSKGIAEAYSSGKVDPKDANLDDIFYKVNKIIGDIIDELSPAAREKLEGDLDLELELLDFDTRNLDVEDDVSSMRSYIVGDIGQTLRDNGLGKHVDKIEEAFETPERQVDQKVVEVYLKNPELRTDPQTGDKIYIATEPSQIRQIEEPTGTFEGGHYFGGPPVKDFKLPLFTTKSRSGAEWYAAERGDGGQVHDIELKAENSLDIDSEEGLNEWMAALDDAKIKYIAEESKYGRSIEIPEVRNHSAYDGTNLLDAVYIPEFRDELVKRGYDSVKALDVLESSEIPTTVIIKSKDQVKGLVEESTPKSTQDINVAANKSDIDTDMSNLEPEIPEAIKSAVTCLTKNG